MTVWDLRAVFSKLEPGASPDIPEGGMAAEASTRRLRPASLASARLQDAVDLGAIRDELANAVHAALEPAHLSVWIKEPPA